jgi:hypothetical protein
MIKIERKKRNKIQETKKDTRYKIQRSTKEREN